MREHEHQPCGLCGRPFVKKVLTEHHCRPRAKGGTAEDVALVCSQCHGMVHATFTNQTLAVLYSTIETLRRAPELQKYIRWVRKQPTSRRTRNEPRRRKV